jgi:hypothetical protein
MKNSALKKNWQVKFSTSNRSVLVPENEKNARYKKFRVKIGMFDEKPAAFERPTPS